MISKDWTPQLTKLLQVGQYVRVIRGKGHPDNEKRHIRAILDENIIVYRVWQPRPGWARSTAWCYFAKHIGVFNLEMSIGVLKPGGKSQG